MLPMGTAARMGPGYFPLLLAAALAVLGVLAIVESLTSSADAASEPTNVRGIVLVTGAIVAFALSIESLGLVPSVALTSFLLSLADRQVRMVPALLTSIVLALSCWLVFGVALSMSWPAFGRLFE